MCIDALFNNDSIDPLINNNEFTTPLAHTPGALSEVSADSSMTTTTTTTTTSPFVNDGMCNNNQQSPFKKTHGLI